MTGIVARCPTHSALTAGELGVVTELVDWEDDEEAHSGTFIPVLLLSKSIQPPKKSFFFGVSPVIGF
jgi:hypothetical protein